MSNRATDVFDALIIGGGTSGGVVAKHLSEAGMKVVVLEQGEWPDRDDLPGEKVEYEFLAAMKWWPNPNVRDNPADYPINVDDSDTEIWMYNGVGGSSVLWAGCWIRALPSDFRVRTLDGVCDDWPISYEDLLPFYQEMDHEIGAAVKPGNTAYPPDSRPAPMDAHPINPGGRKAAEGLNKLGWHWWPGHNGIPTKDYNNLKQCERLGVCRMGCPNNSKFSSDLTHFPVAIKHGARVVTGARVSEITLDENGRANGAKYFRNGRQRSIAASRVIVACNGIGTPRLLLLSKSERFPNGLANSSGLVGKRLMTHPYGTAIGIYDDFLEDWLGPVGEMVQSLEFYETDASRGFVRGAKWHIMATGGPMQSVGRMKVDMEWPDDFWGENFCKTMKKAIGHIIEWCVVPEDLPEETNCVTLDPILKDTDGLPAAKVRYKLSDNTQTLLDFHLKKALELHRASGAKKAWINGRAFASGHNMGTAKMGDDPRTSVVNGFGQTHDVPNLYIVDGSVFTTSTGVNPTATICAIAKRTGTHIADSARKDTTGVAHG